ncbi:hypothetical protein ACH4E8_20045 [Streptomyces sp. NPDC017979]
MPLLRRKPGRSELAPGALRDVEARVLAPPRTERDGTAGAIDPT